MAKKTISKIAAITLASLTAFSTVGVVASADVQINSAQEIWGTVVKVTSVTGVKTTYTYNATDKKWEVATEVDTACNGIEGKVFSTDSNVSTAWKDIVKPENDTKPTGTLVDGQTYSTYSYNYTTSPVDLSALYNTGTVVKYDSKTGEINGTSGTEWTVKVGSSTNGTTGTGTTTGGNVTYTTPSSTYRTPSDTVYYSQITGMYYPNLSALQNVEGAHTNYTSHTTTSKYSSTNRYFDPTTGMYTSSSTSTFSYVVNGATSSSSTAIYKVGNYYYPSYSAAYNAADGNSNLISWVRDYTSLPTNYFSEVTGTFYNTYAAALSASNGYSDKVTVLNGAYYDYYYGYPYYGYYDGYYDYYYGYYNYNDPYYYYFLNKNNSSSSSKDTTTATLGSKKGWKSIATYLKKVSAGSSATIDMNKETVIPSEVTAAIKGRNVTLKFVLDNGVTFTVNGKDVTTAKDVDVDTKYNTKSISKNLIKAAYKKNDAVSSAQLSIDAGTLGFNADLTVKFSAKRGGYKAKLYRYNAAKNSLSLVDTATIGSTGKCNFDNVTKGGEFVVVIYK